MVAIRWTLGAIVAATAVSASTDELQFISRLLKRQEPGSPAYNCHDNCGQAIIEGRNSADACHDDIFLTDYKVCLQCAGPDNQDIWQYYGTTLTKDASPCGLSTTPLSGKQPDAGAAIPAKTSSGSSSSSQATPTASSSKTEASPTETAPTESVTSTEAPGATESQSGGAGGASTTAEVTSSASGETSAPGATESHTGYGSAPATESTSATGASKTISTHAPQGTGNGSGSGNGTATTSSGYVVVTNAANAVPGSHVGFYGALALGALYAAAQ
ncbi:uncharacterized protein F4822DRAFT_420132 [Hypoxylon trugodes]|uniref:uncharacterized protein n=1 Tax=Hypoxylon trugodes TaxID=326681 RepID=UPI0021923F0B|nr:uncharacterized protein F4822DRAFT_420132 [Hypoxylon trugodes]KAI1383312.1 hypothetical protein F4822DRAFT_420132 [Hypoxylon trugodes]